MWAAGRATGVPSRSRVSRVAADGDFGAVGDLGAVDTRAIHVGPVLALKIDDDVAIVLETKLGVRARYALLRVGEDDVVVAAAAYLQPLLADLEDLLDTFTADDS